MVLILYGLEPSPACRTVLLTLNALGLEFKIKQVQLKRNEQKTDAFRNMNPLEKVPVLEDEGRFLTDSHAISAYLVRKYGKDDSLYPKDFKSRALVDQRLFFDSGVMFAALRNIAIGIIQQQQKILPQYKYDAVIGGYTFLETFLEHKYMTGDDVTIADFSLLATVSSLNVIIPVDEKKFPKLIMWMELMTKLPYYERGNEMGLALFSKKVDGILSRE